MTGQLPIFVAFVTFVVLTASSSVALAQETIAEIRVHGNHTTPDADVLELSGLKTGEPASDSRLSAAEQSLRTSGRFADVEVRKRLRSIESSSDILVVILVDERAGVSSDDLTPGFGTRLRSAAQWLPVFNYADGYGFTYGLRAAFADVTGADSRLSFPFSWGAERRAGVELERSFNDQRTRAGVAFWVNRRVNPHFELPDLRQQIRFETDHAIQPWARVGASARIAQVDFGDAYEARHSAVGAHVTFDTRIDPLFPRNAIFARTGWERMGFGDSEPVRSTGTEPVFDDAGRWSTDVRGFVGVVGPVVLALRGQLVLSDAPVPAAEQVLLGGADSLRGYRTGHRAGENMTALSAEVRVPVTSPLNFGLFGVKAFADAGTVWSFGEERSDQPFDRGIGGGIFLGATVFKVDVDVAWPEEGKPRVHVGLGISF